MRTKFNFRVIIAFFAIYFVWGSTYFAIRVLVETVPPLFAAGTRFFIAGAALYLWSRMRGVATPTRLEWRNLAVLGALMFLAAYSALFWAEKTVPSGIASVLVSTIPVWTALFDVFVFKRESLQWSLVTAVCLGVIGVSILAFNTGSGRLNVLACLAILGAEISWSFGTVLSKSMALPASKLMSAAGQMLTGGVMLLLFSAIAGELHPFPQISARAGLALIYLIIAGSIVAFTAYMWLLGRLSATTVSSYAYVNPVIALALGFWLGGETLSVRTIIGAALVLVSVVLLLRRSGQKPAKSSGELAAANSYRRFGIDR